ncbi:MAG: hypothetical protein Q4G26_03730 [Paracoccus sp. (in: a-proteobacteria)]|nr:hypothetical protein [Paracoccus sp. (in: a-proteobacteria)]
MAAQHLLTRPEQIGFAQKLMIAATHGEDLAPFGKRLVPQLSTKDIILFLGQFVPARPGAADSDGQADLAETGAVLRDRRDPVQTKRGSIPDFGKTARRPLIFGENHQTRAEQGTTLRPRRIRSMRQAGTGMSKAAQTSFQSDCSARTIEAATEHDTCPARNRLSGLLGRRNITSLSTKAENALSPG